MSARILEVSPDDYHQLPGLSASTAKVLLAQSPLHAKARHAQKPTKGMDMGTVGHRLVLGKGKAYEVLAFGDYKTNAAKAARDAARANGLVPILEDDFAKANRMAEACRVQLLERDVILDGASELAIEWTEPTIHGDVLCRGMLDHVWLDTGVILDLKFTSDAAPSSVERTAENLGYAVQEAAYLRGLTQLRPELAGRIRFLFGFCEDSEPFAMNLTASDGVFRELGERRWLRAVNEWARCTKNDTWPGYGTSINHITAPAWALAREGYSTDER
jgi:hypothetical protein